MEVAWSGNDNVCNKMDSRARRMSATNKSTALDPGIRRDDGQIYATSMGSRLRGNDGVKLTSMCFRVRGNVAQMSNSQVTGFPPSRE